MPIQSSINSNVSNKSPPKIDYEFPNIIKLNMKNDLWNTTSKEYIELDIPGCIYRIVREHKKISISECEKILKANDRWSRTGDVIRGIRQLTTIKRRNENLIWIDSIESVA